MFVFFLCYICFRYNLLDFSYIRLITRFILLLEFYIFFFDRVLFLFYNGEIKVY